MMTAFKEDLELQLEKIFDDVIRDIKSLVRPQSYEDHPRYKRDLEKLDKEIAELLEVKPASQNNTLQKKCFYV